MKNFIFCAMRILIMENFITEICTEDKRIESKSVYLTKQNGSKQNFNDKSSSTNVKYEPGGLTAEDGKC